MKDIEDFQHKVYDKFTELFVSQKGILDLLNTFNSTVDNISVSISEFHLEMDKMKEKIDKTKETIIKQSIIISFSVKIALAICISLSAISCFMFKEGCNGIIEIPVKILNKFIS
jgi:hypothetical protein